MSTLKFTKGQGTGNDFILFSDPEGKQQLSAEQIVRLCDRKFGVGADGVIRAVHTRAMPEGAEILAEEPAAEWFLDSWNADGSPSVMCANGIRIYVDYLIAEGHIDIQNRRDTIAIGTRSGVRDILLGVSGYSVDLGRWRLEEQRLVSARNLEVARPGLGINLGNSHIVAVVEGSTELDLIDLTIAPDLDPAHPAGANVEFVHPEEPLLKDGIGHIRMRVHEQGSGETLSCGTGAAAAALAFRHWGGAEMPNSWRVLMPGGVLAVRMFATEEGEHVSVSGPAELVFTGTVEL